MAETIVSSDLAVGICLSIAAALAFGLITVQYALFTAAITTYVVLISDTLGEPALRAAGQRALGTVIGIVDRLPGLGAVAGTEGEGGAGPAALDLAGQPSRPAGAARGGELRDGESSGVL